VPLQTNCPSCGEPIEVDDRYAGWTVRCPICQHEFVAPTAPPGAEPRPSSPRPTRRGRRAAARAVANPAVWLKVHGILNIVVGLLGAALYAGIGVWAAANPAQAVQQMNAQNEEEVWFQIVLYTVGGVLSMVAGVVIVIGSGKMARLESHSWAMTAAVLACLPFANWCCCMGLPIGVWGLSVLGRTEVQDAFAAARRRHDDPDDEFGPPEW
jgi:hypothetical protein